MGSSGQQLVYPGYRLDRYELVCPLAYGGMGTIWLGRYVGKLGFEKLVVLKMILPQYSKDPDARRMFVDEARIASRIDHPHVVRITDVGETNGTYYLVMDYVDGDSLSRLLSAAADRGMPRFPTTAMLSVVGHVCEGLHAAHELCDEKGELLHVVHRDVSPQNILLGPQGVAMLIDFGVVKARDRVSHDTRTGQLKGKLAYMAPEQSRGRSADVDRRADVWAVGAILYEHFTGAPPFEAATEVATLKRHAEGKAPDPLPGSVPAPLAAVVMQALALKREVRYPTTLALKHALEVAADECNLHPSTSEVVTFADEALADRRSARKRMIDAAVTAARERRDASGRDSDSALTSADTHRIGAAREQAMVMIREHVAGAPDDPFVLATPAFHPGPPDHRGQGRSKLSLVIGILAGIAVSATIAILVARTPRSASTPPQDPAVALPTGPTNAAAMPVTDTTSALPTARTAEPSPMPAPVVASTARTVGAPVAPTAALLPPTSSSSGKPPKHTPTPTIASPRGNPSPSASITYGF